MLAKPILLAVYITVAWYIPHDNTTNWHEFELPQHFFSRDLCEYYRPKLTRAWILDRDVPFTPHDIVSTRCGAWTPDSYIPDSKDL